MKSRTETCIGEGKSCVLAIEADKIKKLKEWLMSIGYRSDYLLFVSMLKKSFQRKQSWKKKWEEYT